MIWTPRGCPSWLPKRDRQPGQTKDRAHELKPDAFQGSQDAFATLGVQFGGQAGFRAVRGKYDRIGREELVPGGKQPVAPGEGVQEGRHVGQTLFSNPVREKIGEGGIADLLENGDQTDAEVGQAHGLPEVGNFAKVRRLDFFDFIARRRQSPPGLADGLGNRWVDGKSLGVSDNGGAVSRQGTDQGAGVQTWSPGSPGDMTSRPSLASRTLRVRGPATAIIWLARLRPLRAVGLNDGTRPGDGRKPTTPLQ